MAQACKACKHPQVEEINKRIKDGISERKIAAEFGLNQVSIQTHKKHIERPTAQIIEAAIADIKKADGTILKPDFVFDIFEGGTQTFRQAIRTQFELLSESTDEVREVEPKWRWKAKLEHIKTSGEAIRDVVQLVNAGYFKPDIPVTNEGDSEAQRRREFLEMRKNYEAPPDTEDRKVE